MSTYASQGEIRGANVLTIATIVGWGLLLFASLGSLGASKPAPSIAPAAEHVVAAPLPGRLS